VLATLRNGRTVALGRAPRTLAGIRSLRIVSTRSGYRLTLLRGPAGATVRLARPARQASAPNPGPTVEIRLPSARSGSFAARIAVG
jgi:hypothetical protein